MAGEGVGAFSMGGRSNRDTPPQESPPTADSIKTRAETMGKKSQPIRDWVDQLFDEDRRADRRARIREIWEDSRDLLIGLYEELMDDIEARGQAPGEALDHIWSAFLDEVVDDIAAAADHRLDWAIIPRADLRRWLEERDGDFIRRLLLVARARAARRRTRPRASRLLTLLPGPVVKPGAPPRIRQHSAGRPAVEVKDVAPAADADAGAVLETIEADHVEEVKTAHGVDSSTIAARRMAEMLRGDRAVTRGGGDS